MNKIKVIKWISEDESKKYEQSFGGLGGWFKDGMRWKDYIEAVYPEKRAYAKALRKEILRLELKEDGHWHQNDEAGHPLFSDNITKRLLRFFWAH